MDDRPDLGGMKRIIIDAILIGLAGFGGYLLAGDAQNVQTWTIACDRAKLTDVEVTEHTVGGIDLEAWSLLPYGKSTTLTGCVVFQEQTP